MKICPECKKSNIDLSVSCIECFGDLSQVSPAPDVQAESEHVCDHQLEKEPDTSWLGSLNLDSAWQESYSVESDEVIGNRTLQLELGSQKLVFDNFVLFGRGSRHQGIAKFMHKNPKVSRIHAWLGYLGNELFIIDLHSKHGTFISSNELHNGIKRQLTPGEPMLIRHNTIEIVLADQIRVVVTKE